MLNTEQKNQIKQVYNKYFKDSLIDFRESLFESNKNKYIYISCYCAKDKAEVYNNYLINDMFKISFELVKVAEDNYILLNHSSSYLIKPVFETWMAYNSIKVSFRKTQGDFNKIIATLDKYFKKFNESLKDSLEKNYIDDRLNIDCFNNNVSHKNILLKHLVF